MIQKDAEQTADRFLKLYKKGFLEGGELAKKNLVSSIYFLFQVTSRNPKLVFKIDNGGNFKLGNEQNDCFMEDVHLSEQAQAIFSHLKNNNSDMLIDSITLAFTLDKAEYERQFKNSLPRH